LGYGGVDIFCAVDGVKSPVRFAQGVFPKVIVKMEDGSDPSEVFFITPLSEIKKERRRFKLSKAVGPFSKSTGATDKIKVSAKKIRDKVYELTPQGTIVPVDFALINDATGKVFCFGVD
jgi:hypothetical protein